MTVLALLIGLVIGAALVGVLWRRSRTRQEYRNAENPDPAVHDEPSPPAVAGLDLLRAALDALPVGVVYANADGVVVVRNRAAESATGTRHGDILVDEAVDQALAAAARSRDYSRTVEFMGPPPKSLLLQTVAVEAGGTLVTITDVTERNRIDAVRTDFVANISHELKTPVGAMSLLAETLSEADDPADVERLASRMVAEAERLTRTIEDLLELAQIELSGQVEYFPVRACEIVEAAVERTAALAATQGVMVEATVPDHELMVVGNRLQLVSALGNLIGNAVKYSDAGSRVCVSVGRSDGQVHFSVRDTGMGIAPQHHERIFERFYRVDRARSRGTGGVGLGLAIVRHVATNHGGEVNVVSQEGEGSTFTLTLPDRPASS